MNKEIKIIDLINKELNDEEMPLLIKYLGLEYSYAKYKNDYILLFTDEETYFFRDMVSSALTFGVGTLNNKVEILNGFEEDKSIIEKLNLDRESLKGKEVPRAIDYLLEGRINEIIEFLSRKEDK